jgi:hypothetical protein
VPQRIDGNSRELNSRRRLKLSPEGLTLAPEVILRLEEQAPSSMELSFGERPRSRSESSIRTPPPPSELPYRSDPFDSTGHQAVTPTASSSGSASSVHFMERLERMEMESPATELGARLNRCQFTPDAMNRDNREFVFRSPDITPIRGDDESNRRRTPLRLRNASSSEEIKDVS